MENMCTRNLNLEMHCRGATPKDFRVLPKRIILVRHAESEGNIDNFAYTYVPDPQVPLVRPTDLPIYPSRCHAWPHASAILASEESLSRMIPALAWVVQWM